MSLFLSNANWLDKAHGLLQYATGLKPISQGVGWLAHREMGGITTRLVRAYSKFYQVDLSEALEQDVTHFRSLNDFFTRRLMPESRPIANSPVISPVDGTISALGVVENGQLLQIKGHSYSLENLFGGLKKFSSLFQSGAYCTLTLSPGSYHRIHAPVTGRPKDMIYIPGHLFSLSMAGTLPGIYTRNERVISIYKSELGPMALIMVGSLLVGSIETVWEGQVAPGSGSTTQTWEVPDNTPLFQQGAEVGHFNFGSTVIIMFLKNRVQWLPELEVGTTLRMGQALG